MNFVFAALLILFCTHSTPLQQEINGKYKIEFEAKYSDKNGVITFNHRIFEHKIRTGKITKGKILRDAEYVVLDGEDSELLMEFFAEDIAKDTIFFGTRKRSEPIGENQMVVFTGQLVKIR